MWFGLAAEAHSSHCIAQEDFIHFPVLILAN